MNDKESATNEIKPDPAFALHVELLHHALGMRKRNYRRKLEWWLDNDNHRNYFATGPDCDGYSEIVALEELGLMKRGRDIPGGLIYFHVTPEGMKLAKQHRPEW